MKRRGKTKGKKSFKILKKKAIIISFIVILLAIIFLLIFKNTNITGDATENETCIPNWKCSEFFPEKCPKEEIRVRSCIDLNNCETLEGKPELTQACERKNILIPILIGILIFAVLQLSLYLIKRIFKKKIKYKERPKSKDKQYKNDPNYPSEIEQYYGSDQTHNFKTQKKPKNTNKPQEEDEYSEKFPEKYWPK
jgi:amino acid transporter